MSKNTSSYASCRSTNLVRQKLNSIVFFALGASFSITAHKSRFCSGVSLACEQALLRELARRLGFLYTMNCVKLAF